MKDSSANAIISERNREILNTSISNAFLYVLDKLKDNFFYETVSIHAKDIVVELNLARKRKFQKV